MLLGRCFCYQIGFNCQCPVQEYFVHDGHFRPAGCLPRLDRTIAAAMQRPLLKNIKISFVVAVYNGLSETREMLESLQASLPVGLTHEIILSDDSSSDGVSVWLNLLSDPQIRVKNSTINRGYAANINAGVGIAKGDIICLLNNDLLFEPGWLEPMIEVLLCCQLNCGLVGNVHYRIADGSLDHAGIGISPAAQFYHISKISDFAGPLKTLAVTGACVMLRKRDFEKVGGFDETFENGGEDIDLCFKIRQLTKNIYVAKASQIRHHVGLTRKKDNLRDFRNSRHLYRRWRKEIKWVLVDIWLELLSTGPRAYADKLDGKLVAKFLETPHTASLVIAESMLRRQESFWAEKLSNSKSHLAGLLSTRGLKYSSTHAAFLLERSGEFHLRGFPYVRNFYVCGFRAGNVSIPSKIEIRVNDRQMVEFELSVERNINAGIRDPLLVQNTECIINVESTQPLLLTHVVVNDRILFL